MKKPTTETTPTSESEANTPKETGQDRKRKALAQRPKTFQSNGTEKRG